MIEIWDLALSNNGDLIMSGAKDLAGISGTDLIEQRIRLRLRLDRGSWELDDSDSLGSRLAQITGMTPLRAQQVVPAYVREALRDMQDEISVDDVQISFDSRVATLQVEYRVLDDATGAAEQDAETVEITIPFGGTI